MIKDMRCVHLDFHTSEDIPGIGKDFDKDEFVRALKTAELDSISLFAKGHHGNFYYYSDKYRTHPGLVKPLLDLQVEACREAGVSAKIYISAGLDEYSAKEHPEWLVVGMDGQPQNMLRPHFHRLCFNTPYLDLLVEQTEEVTRRYMPDGLFFDIIAECPCTCRWCRADMEKKGLDYRKTEDVMVQARDVLHKFTDRITAAARAIKPDTYVFYNAGDFPVGRHDRIDVNDQLEAESLPTGGWGYDHFPMSMAYIRKLGKNCIGMTGKFHKTWGEFGGFKYKDALLYEAAQCLAFDAGVNVGDQLHPTGRVDAYTYENIGNAMRYVKEREPWRGGEYLPEIAVLSGGPRTPLGRTGVSRMLFEAKYQFDIIEPAEISNKYPLIILADGDTELARDTYAALRAYVDGGGKLLACRKAPLLDGKMAFRLGAEYLGEDEVLPTYIQAKYPLAAADGMALAVYAPTAVIRGDGDLLADKVEPYFKREGTHFCSHNNTPCDYDKRSAGITEGPDGIYVAADLFQDYATVGSLNSKQLILPLLRKLLGGRKMIETNLPTSGKTVLYKKDGKYYLHLLYANTVKRGDGIEIIEDLVTLCDIEVSLDLPTPVTSATLRPSGKAVPVTVKDGRVTFTLDRLRCSEIVELA